ncbi:MAG: tyrosine-type recombinase/integrase [Rhizobiaceae bacterium]
MKRTETTNQYHSHRIPADVLERARGLTLSLTIGGQAVSLRITDKTRILQFSVRTADRREAKLRKAQANVDLGRHWQALRQDCDAPPLSPEEAFALAGELRDLWMDERRIKTAAIDAETTLPGTRWYPAEPGFELTPPEAWESVAEALMRPNALKQEPEEFIRPHAKRLLLKKGIGRIDEGSMALLCRALVIGLKDAFALRMRHARGDFSQPPQTFPKWERGAASEPAQGIRDLFDSWWKEAEKTGKTPATCKTYRNSIERFIDHLGHQDAQRVTPADVVAFKDARLAEGKSRSTINAVDLGSLKSVFGWAVTNHKMATNPAEGIKLQRNVRPSVRPKGFTAAEAKTILGASLAVDVTAAPRHLALARRWVPWLCAYTGARVGEITQLRRQDITEVGKGVWTITIAPEAGTVKTKQERTVVLHEHLVEMGFTKLAEGRAGHVFLPASTDTARLTVNRQVAAFARKACPNLKASPNHGWRHSFKTIGRQAGIADSVLDAICGHAPASIGGGYGEVTLRTQADAMAKFPRFELASDGGQRWSTA